MENARPKKENLFQPGVLKILVFRLKPEYKSSSLKVEIKVILKITLLQSNPGNNPVPGA
jgi:hypothetical protein